MKETAVLWLDNDRAYLEPYIDELEDQGFSVTTVETAGAAELALTNGDYAYVIVDVMIPTRSEEEEALYPPTETNLGYRTGVVFWRRNRERLVSAGVAVLVLTVRLDETIREELAREGLPRANFATKYELSDPAILVDRLQKTREAARRSAE